MTSAEPTGSAARALALEAAADEYAVATADGAHPHLFTPLSFLLAQVRAVLQMDVAFVSRFDDGRRVFEVVSREGEPIAALAPGCSDPLLDTYCQRIVDGRLPRVIPDTAAIPDADALAVTSALRIKAYLSAPVILPNGVVFGTVCCISHSARSDLRESDARALQHVANAVAATVDMRTGRIRYASWTAPGQT
jgi:GAF domain-containing protein